MYAFLRTILSLRFGAYILDQTEEHANLIHARIRRFFTCLVAFGIVGIVANINGYKGVNFGFSVLFCAAGAIFASRPRILAAVFGLGALANKNGRIQSGNDALKQWSDFILSIMLWSAIFFQVAGTLSFGNNTRLIIPIISGIIIISLADIRWGFTTRLIKPTIYLAAIVQVIIMTGTFVPKATYIKVMGFYPYAIFQTSETEELLAQIDEALATVAPKDDTKQLKNILAKINRGEVISADENNFIAKIRTERTAPGKASKKIVGWFGSKDKSAKSIPQLRGQNVHLSLKAGEETNMTSIPLGMYYDFFSCKKSNYMIVLPNGQELRKGDTWPEFRTFKIVALNDAEIDLKNKVN